MYTGIVQGTFEVIELKDKPGLKTFVVQLSDELVEDVKIGASISIDGVCHTVVKIDGVKITFDSMDETLKKTTIGKLKLGDTVNIERSAKMGDEIGGHVMSGHIVGMAEVVNIREEENNYILSLQFPEEFSKFILDKGFIGLDGCSLTIVDLNKDKSTFDVWLIPETLRATGFGKKKVGDKINIEIDSRTQAIIETVEQYLKANDWSSNNKNN